MGPLEQRKSLVWASLLCVGVVASGLLLWPVLPLSCALPLYLLPVLVTAWRLGWKSALAVCFTATLTLDFFYTEPRYTFRVLSASDLAALLSFLATSLLVSRLSTQVRQDRIRVGEQEAFQQALYELSRRSLQLDWRDSIAEQMCAAVMSCFTLEAVAIFDADQGRSALAGQTGDRSDALTATYLAQRDYLLGDEMLLVLRSGVRLIGSILLRDALMTELKARSIANLVASAMERSRALHGEVLAQSERVSEQLRTSVLDGLAHSIKTPLTTISVASSAIAALGELSPEQLELVQTVEEQSHHIASLADTLLRTARMDPTTVLEPQPLDLVAMLRTVVAEVAKVAPESSIHCQFQDSPLSITGDPKLLTMAVMQLLENALKYGALDAPVSLCLVDGPTSVLVRVTNVGSYIPPEEQRFIFKRFYRGKSIEHQAPGTGLGLSVALQAIEAHAGEIRCESDQASGTTFTIELPKETQAHAGFGTDRRRRSGVAA